MDPLTIATSATALAASAFRLSKSIYACVDKIKSADATLLQLQSEVNALHSGLESIASTFKSDDVVQLCDSKYQKDTQSAKLLTNVRPLLMDCENTLGKLDAVLDGIEGKPGRTPDLLRQPVIAIKIDFKSKDIDLVRHQIRSYSSAMQLTLHMVGICLTIDSNKQVENLGVGLKHQLAALASQITDVQNKVSESNESQLQDREPIVAGVPAERQHTQHLEEYIRSAKLIYSDASIYSESVSGTLIGNSADVTYMTETFGSVLGLNNDQRNRVKQWLPGEQTNEENESDEDDDWDITLFRARRAVARKRLEAKEYKAAEIQFRSCLANTAVMNTLPVHEVIDLKLELSSACQGSGDRSGQQAILLELIELDIPEIQLQHLKHNLAVAYVEDSQLDLARKCAEDAMKGRRKLLGRGHESYRESVSLLADICTAQNNIDDADVYRHLLPQGLVKQITPIPVVSIEESAEIKLLSENGFDINNNEAFFNTLDWALKEKHDKVVDLLLENVSNITDKDRKMDNILVRASGNRQYGVIRRLLDQGADIEAEGNSGDTSLCIASRHGHLTIVQLLLERGAEVDHTNTKKSSPLNLASWNGHETIVRLLLERGAQMDHSNQLGNSALCLASLGGHEVIIRLLLRRGAQIDHSNIVGKSALSLASENGYVKIVQLLLERGAQIDRINKEGNSPLLAASESGHMGVVRLLLERGANSQLKNKYGETALNLAKKKRYNNEVVKLLKGKRTGFFGAW